MTNAMVLLTPEELRALVVDAVREATGSGPALAAETALPADVMTRSQAAKFLGVNPHMMPKLIKDEDLPAHPFGAHGWRFIRSELIAWVAKRSTAEIHRKPRKIGKKVA